MEHRRGRLPSATEIAAINAEHLIATKLKPADLLFVFGTREDVGLRAARGLPALARGLFPLVDRQRRRDGGIAGVGMR